MFARVMARMKRMPTADPSAQAIAVYRDGLHDAGSSDDSLTRRCARLTSAIVTYGSIAQASIALLQTPEHIG